MPFPVSTIHKSHHGDNANFVSPLAVHAKLLPRSRFLRSSQVWMGTDDRVHVYIGFDLFALTDFRFNPLFSSPLLGPTAKMRYPFIASLLSIATTVYSYADPMPCTGICNNAHDPALIRRADGTYFRFSTGGKIAIHTAPSITGPWTYKGAAIPAGSKINLPGKDDLWVFHIRICNHLLLS